MRLKSKIRNISDFPQKGIIFRDIAPLLEDKKGFRQAIDQLTKKFENQKIDKIVGIDALGLFAGSGKTEKLSRFFAY